MQTLNLSSPSDQPCWVRVFARRILCFIYDRVAVGDAEAETPDYPARGVTVGEQTVREGAGE
ncbi:hypothetical protein E2C01_065628 [Portunus trituberculatus]|uniref:Uncharacterized protein n=1 Tax=Portunus trituberculatus TaxID=210409 RepID=A0A5B7HF27_PORTR|nr:hypothetical protein [Portunus trituberculatus]